MTRSQRLLELLQLLHSYRYPVTGKRLADQLGISLRTLYRDVATLQQQGAVITNEVGKGYLLKAGLTLPPLMFTKEELEALVIGGRWVVEQTDTQLANAAKQAISKISSVLPQHLQETLNSSLLIGCPNLTEPYNEKIIILRKAINQNNKLLIDYINAKDENSQRTIWPFAIGFFQHTLVICGWCELRDEFRHFRIDRIKSLIPLADKYPRRREDLLTAWHQYYQIPEPLF